MGFYSMESPKVAVLTILVFSCCLTVNGNRQKYGGRVLNIAPNECTSSKFPNVTGTCMISLECQQRSGTVIGACRDGLLFGACCHDANEVVTLKYTEPVSTTRPHIRPESTTTVFKTVLIKNTMSGVLKIQAANSTKKEDPQKVHKDDITSISSDPSLHAVQNVRLSSFDVKDVKTSLRSSLRSTSEMTEATVTTTKMNDFPSQDDANNLRISEGGKKSPTENKLDSSIVNESVTEIHNNISDGTTAEAKIELKVISSIPDSPKLTGVETTTISAPTTKFFYGKIKYSPKPIKFRSTTMKTVWTRPPTTETSYSIFTTSEEEDEDEIRQPVRRVSTERVTTPTSVSTEGETILLGLSGESTPLPYLKSIEEITTVDPKSTEEITIPSEHQKSTEEITTQASYKKSTEEITTQASYQKSTEEITVPYHNPKEEVINEHHKSTEEMTSTNTISPVDSTVMPIEIPKIKLENSEKETQSTNIPQKNVRLVNSPLSHRIGAPNLEQNSGDESSSSTSAGWDNKLDEFVNQVVEGIAEELDKSNIDDVVFKSTSTTPKTIRITTTKATIKSKKKAVKQKKYKPKGDSTRRHESSKTKTKKKPSKKVTISNDVDSPGVILDYKKACGVRPLARKSRIVGGIPSNYGSWPWHAIVKEAVWWGMFSKIKCGGVLIGSRHVLTAAHCQPQQTGKLSVVLGVTDSDNPNTNAVTKAVRRVIRHPQFNPRTYENDIAVLELDSPVQFLPHIVPICLPDLKEDFTGSQAFVTGMGLLKHDGERPLVLHEVDVPILNNSDCQSMYRRSGNSKPIMDSFICAGYPQGLKDSCGGDSGSYPNVHLRHYRSDESNVNETVTEFFSGGPLSVRRPNGQWVLAGTVSHGIKCAVPNQPGIHMRTTWYRPWIEKVTRVARGRESSNCHGPPGTCDYPHTQPKGIFNTLFRVFRLARKFWKSRK